MNITRYRFFEAIIVAFLFVIAVSSSMAGELYWSDYGDIDFQCVPIDIGISYDARWIFALCRGELVVYDQQSSRLASRIPVDTIFTQISWSESTKSVLLASNTQSKVKQLRIDEIISFDLTKLPILGKADAPVTIVVFSDYQCPYCTGLKPLLKQILEANANSVRIVNKHFPLPRHTMAKSAAKAAMAADHQGKFAEMDKLLNDNYNALTEEKITGFVTQLKLDIEKFETDRNNPELEQIINRDLVEGQRVGVRGIPTIYIGGVILEDRSPEGFQKLIDAALARIAKK